MSNEDKPIIHAETFQKPLQDLALTISEKVKREGGTCFGKPDFIPADIYMMIRHMMANYRLLFYMNADERRQNDIHWSEDYGVVVAPAVRTMIDCLYNITAIINDPARGIQYRKSGLKKRLVDIAADEKQYGGKPEWDAHNSGQRSAIELMIRKDGFTQAEILSASAWPTLGAYLRGDGKTPISPHQLFLKNFTYLQWRQYSALSHAGLEGYIAEFPAGQFFILDSFDHETRSKIGESYGEFATITLSRAALLLLCMATEVQAHCRFYGANINERIVKMWQALLGLFEAKQLYDERYCSLMRDRGIAPKE